MGPNTEAHDEKHKRSTEVTPTNLRPASNTPTNIRILSGQEFQQERINEEKLKEHMSTVRDDHEDYTYDGFESSDKKPPKAGAHEDSSSEKRTAPASGSAAISGPRLHNFDKQQSDFITRTADSSPSRLPPLSQVPSMANSLASLSLDSQAPLSSLPSSPRSLSRQSLKPSEDGSTGDGASQAIASDSEDETRQGPELQDSSPQLIMPSIRMPSRRPFTERGKALGRLRILLAGDTGTGKTSLIKSIVQKCEAIVHIDPLTSSSSTSVRLSGDTNNKTKRSSNKGSRNISEVYASTRPYPSWRSEAESVSVLGRRKSMGDTVLERNLCFVDTPGFGSGSSRNGSMERTLSYIGEQAKKSFSATTGEGDLVGLLSGSGGVQVDLVLYLISKDVRQTDMDFLDRVSRFTNVIILLSKSDNQSMEETELLRRSLASHLRDTDIKQFRFPQEGFRQPPFTVCSVPSEDDDNMDASLLMSSEYVQPLVPSELDILLDQIFEKETVSCMRHLAAKKLVEAQKGSAKNFSAAQGTSNTGFLSRKPPSSPTSPLAKPEGYGLSPFIQATISDHTLYEERLAQIKLAKWAADLQRSLQNERQRYETLMREEQAAWLDKKLHELERTDKTIGLDGLPRHRTRRSGGLRRYDTLKDQDPLGVAHYYETFMQHGWMALRVAGSFGVLGAFAVWAARNWSNGHWELNWWKGA